MGHLPKKTRIKVRRTGRLGKLPRYPKPTAEDIHIHYIEMQIERREELLGSGYLTAAEQREVHKEQNRLERELKAMRGKD